MKDELNIKETLEQVLNLLSERLKQNWEAQGHRLTGRLENSLQISTNYANDIWTGTIEGEDYGLSLEFGVAKERIPFTPGARRGGKSKYIQGLISFWLKRGLNSREAKGAAFATAHIHKREGIPTRASHRFSRTGARLGAIQEVVQQSTADIRRLIEGRFEGANLEILIGRDFKAADIFKL